MGDDQNFFAKHSKLDKKNFIDLFASNPKTRMNESQRIAREFLKLDAKPQYMKASTYKKYEMLFSLEERNRLSEYTSEEFAYLTALSDEFKNLVNVYKELNIVDDDDPEKILFTIPIQFSRFELIKTKEGQQAITIYDKMAQQAFDRPDKMEAAKNLLMNSIRNAQDKKTILQRNELFLQQATKLHESGVLRTEFRGPGQFQIRDNVPIENNTVKDTENKEDGYSVDEDITF